MGKKFVNNINFNVRFFPFPPGEPECSLPETPVPNFKGVCAVVGTHPCWEKDLSKLRSEYGEVYICGVNEAPRLLACDHLATAHGGKIDDFIQLHRTYQPDSPLPTIFIRDNNEAPEEIEGVDWYKIPVRTMAGSAPFAAGAMALLGYEKVVMCGCPMDGGGGYAFNDTHGSTRNDPRIGYENSEHAMIKSWHMCMKLFKEQFPDVSKRIKSMSGKTKEIYGGIE